MTFFLSFTLCPVNCPVHFLIFGGTRAPNTHSHFWGIYRSYIYLWIRMHLHHFDNGSIRQPNGTWLNWILPVISLLGFVKVSLVRYINLYQCDRTRVWAMRVRGKKGDRKKWTFTELNCVLEVREREMCVLKQHKSVFGRFCRSERAE